MSSTAQKEYKVLLIHPSLAAPGSGQPRLWRATVLDFPSIVEEAGSREQVIMQIKARIDDILRHAEIVTLTALALPSVQEGPADALTAQGWGDHGLFTDGPEALRLFDAIEAERDQHQVGGA